MLESTVAGGLASKIPLSTDDYQVSGISLKFNVVGDRVEYIFYRCVEETGLLTLNGESDLDNLFDVLPPTHPAKAPYRLFKQASDTVRSGVIIGLGSRLQVFQSELIKKITTRDEIDLELPGQERCAYFLVTSDQDSTFDFLARCV